jgi:hypothetical protein
VVHISIRLKPTILPLAKPHGGTSGNRDTRFNRCLLRAFESGTLLLTLVLGEQESNPHLKLTLGRGYVFRRVGRVEPRSGCLKLVHQPLSVSNVAGQAIKVRNQDAPRLARADPAQRFLKTRPLPLRSRLVQIGWKHDADLQAVAAGVLARHTLLILGTHQVLASADARDSNVNVYRFG